MALVVADCTFRSGAMGISFDMTNLADTTALLVKDSTLQFYVFHKVYLSCTSAAKLAIYDGSGGDCKIAHSPPVDIGGTFNMAMDFGNDGIMFDDASAVCLSAGAGAFWGFIKYTIGTNQG